MAKQDYKPTLDSLSPPKMVQWLPNEWLERWVKACQLNAPDEKKTPKENEVPISVEQSDARGAELFLDLEKVPYIEVTRCVAGAPVVVRIPYIPISAE